MRLLLSFGAVLWLSVVAAGILHLARYENTPAAGNLSYPTVFPSESRIGRDARRATLVFFAHPKCPCTRASLRELARLVTDTGGSLQAIVVFIKPKGESEQWTETDLRANAAAIPNVRVLIDEDERETRIFGAQTSGLALVYDRAGNLRFGGGITASRGHEGDNAGSRAIFEIITGERKEEEVEEEEGLNKTAETAVFGCPLHKKDCHDGELMEKTQ
ncbi:MAG: RedB protein [Acidobacteriota bacterium]|nr:RedB protein [Acidobacteriota bacterium]